MFLSRSSSQYHELVSAGVYPSDRTVKKGDLEGDRPRRDLIKEGQGTTASDAMRLTWEN